MNFTMRGNIYQEQPKAYNMLLDKETNGSKGHSCRTPTLNKFFPICVVGSIWCLGLLCLTSEWCPLSSLPTTQRAIKPLASSNSQGTPSVGGVISTNNNLLNEYQICHPSDWDSYVCKGPAYDDFADKLEALLLNQEHTRRHNNIASHSISFSLLERKPPLWGKRQQSPFPANTTILALGNSHTRQVLQALPCQYPTLQFIDMESPKSDNVMRRGSYYFVEFANHAKLHLVTNNAMFYSKQWPRYLKELVMQDEQHDNADDNDSSSSLEDYFDALIVGKMNDFADAYNTSFMEVMMEKTAKLEDADFSTNPPPTLLHFVEEFPSLPIVAHSMFCDWGGEHLYWDMYDKVQEVNTRDNNNNVRLVNGRQYAPLLGECGSNQWQSVGVCEDDATAHRCIGERGGHPDLVAWDVIEAMHDLLGH
jgi:hypothetical protein